MISAQRYRPAKVAGFTLIEILVVVVIIGVMTGAFLVSFNIDRHDEGNKEARRFSALMRLAGQEAVLSSKDLAVELFSDGYRFLVSDEQTWHLLEDDILSSQQLPEGISLLVKFDGSSAVSKDNADEEAPRIYLYSTGEITPFDVTLTVEGSDIRYSITGGLNGKLEYAELQ